MFPSIDLRLANRRPLRTLAASLASAAVMLGTGTAPGVPVALAATSPLVPGAMTLTRTINSVGVEVKFSGDDNANASAALQFKKSTDAAWRSGLPLWRTDDKTVTPGRAFYGSALKLEPATAYNVRVTLTDPDGVSGTAVLNGTITTRADNIPAWSALTATYYVTASGNDASAGTTIATAWRTIDKALKSAPAGAVVEVGPGYFKASTATRTTPITLMAQYPAVDDAATPINLGKHTVIDSGVVSAPAAGPGVVAAPWQQVALADPANPSVTYTVWKWASTGMTTAIEAGYATSRTAEPKRLASWQADTLDLATPAGWAKKLYTNQTYNFGFYASGQDVYARFPGDANPNTLYVTLGNATGFNFDGPNISLYGFELRQFKYGVLFGPNASFGVVDHSQFVGNWTGITFRGLAGAPPTYGSDHVLQFNRIADSSLWTANHTADPGIPWTFIKSSIVNADGTTYAKGRLGALNETVGVYSRDGGAQRVVVRHNTIDGTFNGVSLYPGTWTDRYASQDMDVYANYIHHISDDALEPSGQAINFRAWGNRIEDASDVLSADPLNYGPVYLFRNTGWRLGVAGVPYNAQGQPTYGGSTTPSSVLFKYDDASSVEPIVFVLHNTLWADPNTSAAVTTGGADYGGGSGGAPTTFYLRNNIVHTTRYAFEAETRAMWNEDYDNFSTTDKTRGLKFNNLPYTTNVGAYRTASGQGAHTNLTNDFVTTPLVNNPQTGDLGLPVGSLLIDAGVRVPNLSDLPGVNFNGPTPDLGAEES